MRLLVGLVIIAVTAACSEPGTEAPAASLDPLAERYVRLVLALGVHDEYYVDAYFGPPQWRDQAGAEAKSLQDIIAAAASLAEELRAFDVAGDERLRLRQDLLASNTESLGTVARMRAGERLSFDEESRLVYGFVAPSFPVEHYDEVLQELEALLPGDSALHERIHEFEQQFRVPPETAEAVVAAGIEECRERTLQHLALPAGEAFDLEMVSGNPWGAYNWYKGDFKSLIQVETSRPISVFHATILGCHEGYPGHHAFSSLLEQHYLRERGWVEFSVIPLHSPQGVIFEGSGNLAEDIAFPAADKAQFLREVIEPIAGIDNADYATRSRLSAVRFKIRYAGIEAARKYLDGDWDREQAEDWLTHYALTPPENVDAWFAFTDRYRAYRINYVLGKDLVREFVRRENPDGDNEGDWQALAKLLSHPPAPMLFRDR